VDQVIWFFFPHVLLFEGCGDVRRGDRNETFHGNLQGMEFVIFFSPFLVCSQY